MEVDRIVKHIIKQYGENIFYDNKRLSSLLMDFISEKIKQRNILKIAINANIPNKLLNANKLDISDKKLIAEQCKLILCDDYCIEQEWAEFAVNCFTNALEWNIKPNEDIDKVLADIVMNLYNS